MFFCWSNFSQAFFFGQALNHRHSYEAAENEAGRGHLTLAAKAEDVHFIILIWPESVCILRPLYIWKIGYYWGQKNWNQIWPYYWCVSVLHQFALKACCRRRRNWNLSDKLKNVPRSPLKRQRKGRRRRLLDLLGHDEDFHVHMSTFPVPPSAHVDMLDIVGYCTGTAQEGTSSCRSCQETTREERRAVAPLSELEQISPK